MIIGKEKRMKVRANENHSLKILYQNLRKVK